MPRRPRAGRIPTCSSEDAGPPRQGQGICSLGIHSVAPRPWREIRASPETFLAISTKAPITLWRPGPEIGGRVDPGLTLFYLDERSADQPQTGTLSAQQSPYWAHWESHQQPPGAWPPQLPLHELGLLPSVKLPSRVTPEYEV